MAKPQDDSKKTISRRTVIKDGVRSLVLLGAGSAAGFLAGRSGQADEYRWQIDPDKCISCGYCATKCVLDESAVKCVQSYPMCGYCKLCTGFFEPSTKSLDTGAENQLCPTGAIIRTFVEDPYFEYTIDKDLCIGCAKCVKWCKAFGNASLYLQVQHDRCANCNECAIAVACPSKAFVRVPADQPYLLKVKGTDASE